MNKYRSMEENWTYEQISSVIGQKIGQTLKTENELTDVILFISF